MVLLVSVPLLAVLRHAALDRPPHAAPGLPQGLPRLLGELRRALRPAQQPTTSITIAGRAWPGGSRLVRSVPRLPGRRSRRTLSAPVRTGRPFSLTRARGPLTLGVVPLPVPLPLGVARFLVPLPLGVARFLVPLPLGVARFLVPLPLSVAWLLVRPACLSPAALRSAGLRLRLLARPGATSFGPGSARIGSRTSGMRPGAPGTRPLATGPRPRPTRTGPWHTLRRL
ncbi:hypothetical protein [Micromonospora zamorensis]|uniref:hypothetical protein n=1 Tax=Micromonospora zamorensis TaxID=709883 RepID=UPI0033BB9E7D